MAVVDVKDSGEAQRVDCGDRGLFVYRDEDGIRADDSCCPHQSTNIRISRLEGSTLTRPKH